MRLLCLLSYKCFGFDFVETFSQSSGSYLRTSQTKKKRNILLVRRRTLIADNLFVVFFFFFRTKNVFLKLEKKTLMNDPRLIVIY